MNAKRGDVCGKAVRFAAFSPQERDGISIVVFPPKRICFRHEPMNRKQLEHVLRAGGSLTSSRDLVVIGSQAILGSFPNAPADMLTSMEADVYPMDAPDKADMIDGCIGEL